MATGYKSVIDANIIGMYARKRLLFMANKMRGGRMWDNHDNGTPSQADAIALTVRGDMICLRRGGNCSCNPVVPFADADIKEVNGEKYEVYLSTSATGPNWYWKGTWETSIEKFNESVQYSENYGAAIIAYYVFN